ncbi:TNT domain-containing protein [Actinokineospora iranica]|uniref:TNT domain-containing protein n=1 Tax=Actinokineospora iranica TaxID=1271860 RepID=UPI000B87178A
MTAVHARPCRITLFRARSLRPCGRSRPYHVYRVARPLPTLRGTAAPWFDPPGGGTGYALANPVATPSPGTRRGRLPRPPRPPHHRPDDNGLSLSLADDHRSIHRMP